MADDVYGFNKRGFDRVDRVVQLVEHGMAQPRPRRPRQRRISGNAADRHYQFAEVVTPPATVDHANYGIDGADNPYPINFTLPLPLGLARPVSIGSLEAFDEQWENNDLTQTFNFYSIARDAEMRANPSDALKAGTLIRVFRMSGLPIPNGLKAPVGGVPNDEWENDPVFGEFFNATDEFRGLPGYDTDTSTPKVPVRRGAAPNDTIDWESVTDDGSGGIVTGGGGGSVTGGCGINVASGSVSFDPSGLIGDGLDFDGSCGFDVSLACGLKYASGTNSAGNHQIMVDVNALIGKGLAPGTTQNDTHCQIAVYPGCGLRYAGSADISGFFPVEVKASDLVATNGGLTVDTGTCSVTGSAFDRLKVKLCASGGIVAGTGGCLKIDDSVDQVTINSLTGIALAIVGSTLQVTVNFTAYSVRGQAGSSSSFSATVPVSPTCPT